MKKTQTCICILIVLISQIKSSCEYEKFKETVGTGNNDIDGYLTNQENNCDWFNAKSFYYKSQSEDKDFEGKIYEFLTAYGNFRLAIIDKYMASIIKGEDDFSLNELDHSNLNFKPLKELKELNEGHYNLIETYLGSIEQTMTFLHHFKDETDYFYILNAFGSVTATSDYDFDITIVPIKDRSMPIDSNYVDQLEYIIEITELKSNLENKFKEKYSEKGMDRSFDANIYPNTAIFERSYEYVPNEKIRTTIPGYFLRKNYVTASAFQLCVVPYLNLLKSTYFNIERFEEFSTICVKNVIISQSNLLSIFYQKKQNSKLNQFFEMSKSKFFQKDNLVLEMKDFEKYSETLNKIMHFFREFTLIYSKEYNKDEKRYQFQECLKKTRSPKLYFQLESHVDGGEVQTEIDINSVMNGPRKVSFYDDLFILPDMANDEIIKIDTIPDRLFVPFLGSCLIFAEEAYVTFGALQYVKNEKALHNGSKTLNCQRFVENYLENFGMLFMHLKDANNTGFDINDKNVSDAVSKYFRRALSIKNIGCYELRVLENNKTKPIDIDINYNKENTNHIAFMNFFEKITNHFNGDDSDKKSKFFQEYILLLNELKGPDFNEFVNYLVDFFLYVTKNLVTNFNYDYLYSDLKIIIEHFEPNQNKRII